MENRKKLAIATICRAYLNIHALSRQQKTEEYITRLWNGKIRIRSLFQRHS